MTHLVTILKNAQEALRKAIEVRAKQAKIVLANAAREENAGEKFEILTAEEVEGYANDLQKVEEHE
eukprot:Seg7328.1 transcript_id=Seg7328.1/GoldUCD/mRNA.D3Y31 product="hypothetical protein" protein_id=Seg7328.1/GoldUCD/D3Y31